MLPFQHGTVTIKLDEQKLGHAYAWTNYTVEVRYLLLAPTGAQEVSLVSVFKLYSRCQSCQYLQAVFSI